MTFRAGDRVRISSEGWMDGVRAIVTDPGNHFAIYLASEEGLPLHTYKGPGCFHLCVGLGGVNLTRLEEYKNRKGYSKWIYEVEKSE